MAAKSERKTNPALVGFCQLLVPVAAVLAVTVIGGKIISKAEEPIAAASESVFKDVKDKLKSLNLTDDQLNNFVRYARVLSRMRDMQAALSTGGNTEDWSFLGGSFFTATLGTGIGYGNFAPQNAGGRAYTVLYGLFALLVWATLLPRVAQTILRPLYALNARALAASMPSKAAGRPDQEGGRPMQVLVAAGGVPQEDRESSPAPIAGADADEAKTGPSPEPSKPVRLLSVLQALLVVWLGGTAIMGRIEQWDYGTSLYWGFSTLTTIGLGDVVPASNPGITFFFFYVALSLGLFAALSEIAADWAKSIEDSAATWLASWAAAGGRFLSAGGRESARAEGEADALKH